MALYQDGDAEAFKQLYQRYSARVYGYIKKRISETGAADEIFQSVFMKLHQSRHQYLSDYRFSPWLFTICRTKIVDYLRSRDHQWNQNAQALNGTESIPTKSFQEISLPLNQLNPTHLEVIELRYQKDMSFEEIANRLSISEPTARKRISRALSALKKIISGENHDSK